MPVTKLAKQIIDESINSYHIFRKSRIRRVYKILRKYMQIRTALIITLTFIYGEKLKLVIDGTILPVANVNRARTRKIKRFMGKQFWSKRNRNLYSEHCKERVSFEELYYGVLVMVLCDTKGIVYDIWFHPASYHEIKPFRIRFKTSLWFKNLITFFEVIGDKGYRGCENVNVCTNREDKAERQIIETVFSRLKRFNTISRWRKGITFLSYLYAYAIGFSFFRNSKIKFWY
jgi:hypothetical protein